jgi:hypothetical protein
MDAVKPLNYAPKPPAARRVWRRVYRLISALAIIVAAVAWGPGTWRHAESIYWEQKCLHFLQPPNHVVLEMNRGNVLHWEVCVPQSRFEGERRFPALGTIFLHEMRRPNSMRCLVSLSDSPIGPSGLGRFRLQCLQWDVSLRPQLLDWDQITIGLGHGSIFSHLKFFAGQPDANNPSHFTFDYELDGLRRTCDAWLDNDGKVIVSQRP